MRNHRAGDAGARLAFQMPVDLDAGLCQLIFQDGARVAGTVLDREGQRQRFAALRQAAGQGKAVQLARHHVQFTVLRVCRAARQVRTWLNILTG